uniref:Uncharacterized protein n=1 Tax=Aegilops tauschii subsp. strangulata TaxID=200361 RepID=A0A453C1A6_AEGTS
MLIGDYFSEFKKCIVLGLHCMNIQICTSEYFKRQIVRRNSQLGRHLGGGYIDFLIMASLSLCASLHVQHRHGQIND